MDKIKVYLINLILVLLVILNISFKSYGFELKSGPSLEELAIARLQTYGVNSNIKFDTPVSNKNIIDILSKFFTILDIVNAASEIDKLSIINNNISENEFIIIWSNLVKNTLNISNYHPNKIGDTSDNFTVGDIALYIEDLIQNYPNLKIGTITTDEIVFPRVINIYPNKKTNIDEVILRAIKYLPVQINICVTDEYSQDDLISLYDKLYKIRLDYEYKEYSIDSWLHRTGAVPYNISLGYQAMYKPIDYEAAGYEQYADLIEANLADYKSGNIDSYQYYYNCDILNIQYFGIGDFITVGLMYSPVWRAAMDADKSYREYDSNEVYKKMDEFFTNNFNERDSLSDYDIIMQAKKIICSNASYDDSEYEYIVNKNGSGRDISHTIEGFVDNGMIVCDGYAEVFEYNA